MPFYWRLPLAQMPTSGLVCRQITTCERWNKTNHSCRAWKRYARLQQYSKIQSRRNGSVKPQKGKEMISLFSVPMILFEVGKLNHILRFSSSFNYEKDPPISCNKHLLIIFSETLSESYYNFLGCSITLFNDINTFLWLSDSLSIQRKAKIIIRFIFFECFDISL